jgi:hypothetical protein
MVRSLLVSAASLAAIVGPAQARSQPFMDSHHSGRLHGVASPVGADFRCDSRRGGHRHDGRGSRRLGCGGYSDIWGYYDPDFNRSWDSDSFNDWWHDRPDRAFPRWVQEQRIQGSCDPDRMWWSGSGWHC